MKKNGTKMKLGMIAISAFIIANMIGTGVFTSLGFQLSGVSNPYAVLLLWIIGGITALCGALVYSELGAAMPRSGGEYHYLGKIYHPAVGFFSGWASLTVGFAAPNAAAALAMGYYFHSAFPQFEVKTIAGITLFLVTFMHSFTIRSGGTFQTLFTSLKVLIILVFIVAGFTITPEPQQLMPYWNSLSWNDLATPAFAVSLVFVSMAYSGWNAATYIAGDIKNPQKTLPRAILLSTAIVTTLYLLLNYVFLYTTPIEALRGVPDVAQISASHIFGAAGGRMMSAAIAFLLISTVSAMAYVGPRVSQVMGEDTRLLHFLSYKTTSKIPIVALWFQFILSFMLIMVSDLEQLIYFAGVPLNICTMLTVIGVFVHRKRFPDVFRPYKTWGYPIVPIIFLGLVLWSLIYLFQERPKESFFGLLTVSSGLVIYFLDRLFFRKKEHNEIS